MHLDAHSRTDLGHERIALQRNAAERDRLHRSLADEGSENRQGRQRLLRRARRRLSAAEARAQ